MKTWKDDLGKGVCVPNPAKICRHVLCVHCFFLFVVLRILTELADTFCLSLKVSPLFFRFSFACV